jgi:hypothetical protein
VLKAGLQLALLQDLDQRIGGQMRLFSGDNPFGAGAFAGPGDVAEECPGRATSQEQPFVQILRCAANSTGFTGRSLLPFPIMRTSYINSSPFTEVTSLTFSPATSWTRGPVE